MPNGQAVPATGLRQCLAFLAPRQPDAELLDRFVATRDDSAFAELVRRHGPVVLAVCRRVTRNRDDAEDAFQAAFLVLARKAGRIRPGEPLGAWLYGVAVNTARVALGRTCRCRARETPVAEWHNVPGRAPPESDPDAVRMLLEEVARLNDRHRAAVVLCELEGRSRSAAADELGIPEGTLSSRLAAARRALVARLSRRGLALTAAGLPLVFAQVAVARPPAGLTARAVATAVGPGATALTPASAAVFTLTNGVLRVMSLPNFKTVPAGLGLIAAVAIAAGLVFADGPPRGPKSAAGPVEPPKPGSRPVPPAAAPKPLPKGPDQILFHRRGDLVMVDPDGKNDRKVADGAVGFDPGFGLLSPDGKAVAYLSPVAAGADAPANRPTRRKLYVKAVDETDPGTDMGVECGPFVWSPDGTEIAFTVVANDQRDPKAKFKATHGIVNVKTKEKAALKLPDSHMITDWARDGRHFLTTELKAEAAGRMYLMNRDGTEHRAVTGAKEGLVEGKLSPDGTRVLCADCGPPEKPNLLPRLTVVETATGKSTAVDVPSNAELLGFCWSPDGKRIAYIWREVHEGAAADNAAKETKSFLVVCDPAGKNAKTIVTEKGDTPALNTLCELDWR